jgi:hypothetical protein
MLVLIRNLWQLKTAVSCIGVKYELLCCLNTYIYSYLETSDGQSSSLYLNVVQFFNTSVNYYICGNLRQLFPCIGV